MGKQIPMMATWNDVELLIDRLEATGIKFYRVNHRGIIVNPDDPPQLYTVFIVPASISYERAKQIYQDELWMLADDSVQIMYNVASQGELELNANSQPGRVYCNSSARLFHESPLEGINDLSKLYMAMVKIVKRVSEAVQYHKNNKTYVMPDAGVLYHKVLRADPMRVPFYLRPPKANDR